MVLLPDTTQAHLKLPSGSCETCADELRLWKEKCASLEIEKESLVKQVKELKDELKSARENTPSSSTSEFTFSTGYKYGSGHLDQIKPADFNRLGNGPPSYSASPSTHLNNNTPPDSEQSAKFKFQTSLINSGSSSNASSPSLVGFDNLHIPALTRAMSEPNLEYLNSKRSPQTQGKKPAEKPSSDVKASYTAVPFSSGIVGLN
jgi:hypothetical protein